MVLLTRSNNILHSYIFFSPRGPTRISTKVVPYHSSIILIMQVLSGFEKLTKDSFPLKLFTSFQLSFSRVYLKYSIKEVTSSRHFVKTKTPALNLGVS